MNYNYVRPVTRQCSMCGYNPVTPKQIKSLGHNGKYITEAIWTCPQCHAKFAKGVVNG